MNGSVVIWLAGEERPLVGFEHLFPQAALDLTLRRGNDGSLEVLACGEDGSVRYIALKAADLATKRLSITEAPAPPEEAVVPQPTTMQTEQRPAGKRRVALESVPMPKL